MNQEGLAIHRFRQGQSLHSQGKFAEAAAEYEAALALNPDHVDSLNYLGITIHQRGRTREGLEYIKRALELDPCNLGALTNCGELCRVAGMPLEAEVHLNLAVALYPTATEPRINLGALYINQGRYEEAREILRQAREHMAQGSAILRRLWALAHGELSQTPPERAAAPEEVAFLTGRELTGRRRWTLALPYLERAVTMKPQDAFCWLSLGVAHYERDDKPRAAEAFAKAADLDPMAAVAHTNLGNALMETGDETTAADAYLKAAALVPDEPLARFNQSLQQLKTGAWPEAWALYDYRHRLPKARAWPGERWTGEPIKGKRLLVHCEQGVGDTLQFMRFLAPLRREGATVTLAAQNALSQLCSQVEGVDDFLLQGRTPEFDKRIELLSLPHLMRTTPSTLPPPAKGLLIPRNHNLAQRAAQLKGRKVGLCWAGAPEHKNDWRRSAPLGLLRDLLTAPDVSWVSLQVGGRASDIVTEGWAGQIHNWTTELQDFADTAALIEALDLVITADTAVAHLAATLGKPTWIMLPDPGEWRWGEEAETTIWYPSARLFRQPRPFDWIAVAAHVRKALEQLK